MKNLKFVTIAAGLLAAFVLAPVADAATVTYTSGAIVGSPVSANLDISAVLPSGHTVTSVSVAANFQDNSPDHYFYQTQYAGGNDFNWVYLDPLETAQLTIGSENFQASSTYSYIRYFARTENGSDYFDVVDGYGGAFSIANALAQSAIDSLNLSGLLSFQVASLVGNFKLVDVSLTFQSQAPALETPIPAAFPLFAAGLSAMGLMGWRRKRKTRV